MRFDSPTPVPLVARPTYWLTAATVTGLLVVLVFVLWPKEIPQSNVRVRNASSVTLQNVVVGKAHYGDLGPGESSQYQTWGPAYPHPRLEFESGGTHFRQIPEDHYGESTLGTGQFTYVLTLAASSPEGFSVVVTKD